ncbi:MAG: hypothetical protein A2075_24160 [Geobacteraceae bacterium GWC2_58_44]|nr:MAG: hypothetical protein A2075_24160 [Geobacteraceae bacterium GWC2_58_44]HBG05110.1 hypothetical protein [Geobacter sp.]
MCTLLLAYQVHPRYPLILAVNRDEFYQRPTAAAAYWEDAAHLFAGRDLVHGGTWLGVTSTGRIAALTNYRQPKLPGVHGRSRGELVSEFLKGETTAEEYLERLRGKGVHYSGYNLLLGDPGRLYCYSNKSDEIVTIPPGVHGLSNHLLNTPWPKVLRGKASLARVLGAGDFSAEELFAILADSSKAPDDQLPDTGVGLETERLLSSIFITGERYGTRSSSILLVDRDGQATFVERSFDGGGARDTKVCFDWS